MCRVPLSQYGTKAEKGSKSLDKLVTATINHKAKDADTSDSCYSVFSSILVQQTGGRNWTAQVVDPRSVHTCHP